MIRQLTRILILFLPLVFLPAQTVVPTFATELVTDSTTVLNKNAVGDKQTEEEGYINRNELSETGNRLPQLLRDVKVHLTDALIADVHKDTAEVLYNLDLVFNLLSEADQLGEMNEEDKEEFDRFENSLIDIYTHRLTTLTASNVAFTAEKLRHEVITLIEPIEVEIGYSKYTVIDDRDGHIPLVTNKKVGQFIHFFQTKGRSQFKIWLDRKAVWEDMILKILDEYSVPPELLYLSMIESGLNPKAYSHAHAVGMWQFVYQTGRRYGLDRTWYIDERRDPEKATRAAAAHLKDLYEQYEDWYLVLGAYNSGAGRINRAVRLHQTSDFWQLHSLPRETRNYIPYYLAAAIIGSNPEKYGFKVPPNKGWFYDEITLDKSADLSVLAKSARIPLKTLREYNPELRQSATPADMVYTLRLPVGKKALFEKNFSALPESKRFAPQYVKHRVRSGENLGMIARKYRVSIHDLAAVNKIKNRHKIGVGKVLTIPVRGQTYTTSSKASVSKPAGTKKKVYTVRKGDTLGGIAENNRTSARKIRSWNGLKYGQYIYPGQKLVLWVKS